MEAYGRMDILELAKRSGFLVTLDGKIGQEQYQSVHGSVSALKRFAEAVYMEAKNEDQQACIAANDGPKRRTG